MCEVDWTVMSFCAWIVLTLQAKAICDDNFVRVGERNMAFYS